MCTSVSAVSIIKNFIETIWRKQKHNINSFIILKLSIINHDYFYNSKILLETGDKRVTEIDYQLKYAIFSTACSIVNKYCTRPIRRHLYSGIFKDPLNRKWSLKINNIHKRYVLCLKLEYFFKNVKLNPWMQQWPWDVSQKTLHGTVAWRAGTL